MADQWAKHADDESVGRLRLMTCLYVEQLIIRFEWKRISDKHDPLCHVAEELSGPQL